MAKSWVTSRVVLRYVYITKPQWVNSLRPRQNGRNFPEDIYKWIFLNENVWILIKISLRFVSKGLINNIPVLVQIMAWRRLGNKPLSEPMMFSLLTHICVTRPQWVKQQEYIWLWFIHKNIKISPMWKTTHGRQMSLQLSFPVNFPTDKPYPSFIQTPSRVFLWAR